MSTLNDLLISVGLDTKSAMKDIKKLDKAFAHLGKAFTESMKEASDKDSLGMKKKERDFQKFQDAVNKERIKDQKAANKKKQNLITENKLRDRNLDIMKRIKNITKQEIALDQSMSIQKQNKLLEKQLKLIEDRNRRAEHFKLSQQSRSSFQALPANEQKRVMKRFNDERSKFLLSGNTLGFKELSEDVKKFKRQLIGLQTVQGGLTDSTRNMVRAYVSLFALLEGTTAIKNVGMQFEGMRAGMLITSDNAKVVGENLEFVDKEATRLGLDIVDTSKSFVRLAAAAKGKMNLGDTKELFLGIAEASTVMQLSQDDLNGALRA